MLSLLALIFIACPAQGQDARRIPISFLPPPLETATFSLGIYDVKSGKLVRRLKEAATQSAFTVGLNGLITSWDGNDDAGKPVPPGRYAARGYAVGVLKVEGDKILGNDWTSDDESLRMGDIREIALVPGDGGLAVLGTTVSSNVGVSIYIARYGGEKTELLWQKESHDGLLPAALAQNGVLSLSTQTNSIGVWAGRNTLAYRLADGELLSETAVNPSPPSDAESPGKDGTLWKIEEGELRQYSGDKRLRRLAHKEDEPMPVQVSASTDGDRLYLLEKKDGWQRVRGLSWKETKEEDGKAVSTWQTFFERNIRMPTPVLGMNLAIPVEINLMENPLDPGKPQKVDLAASYDDRGSYLITVDGLCLRRISERAHLLAAKLSKGKTANGLSLYQSDGAAWDEFSITGARNMMAFDAGEIDMTADGEKVHTEKAAEPPEP